MKRIRRMQYVPVAYRGTMPGVGDIAGFGSSLKKAARKVIKTVRKPITKIIAAPMIALPALAGKALQSGFSGGSGGGSRPASGGVAEGGVVGSALDVVQQSGGGSFFGDGSMVSADGGESMVSDDSAPDAADSITPSSGLNPYIIGGAALAGGILLLLLLRRKK